MKTLKHKLLSGEEIDLPEEAVSRVNNLVNDLPKIRIVMEKYDKGFPFRSLYLWHNIRQSYGEGNGFETDHIERLIDIDPNSQESLKLKEELFLIAGMKINSDYAFNEHQRLKQEYKKKEEKIDENENQIYDPIIDALVKINPKYEEFKRIAIRRGEVK